MEGLSKCQKMYSVSQGWGLIATHCSVGSTGSRGSVQGCWWLKQKTKQTAPDHLAGIVLDVIPGMSWQT